ncbi:hypothetical protein VNO77_27944 [Canavalia gladiata]|uniref:Uncharacterized protein n=1 Tax=Canavalia gladiata TaxID=3824 RepID=A0AAN9QAZ9_CANGL
MGKQKVGPKVQEVDPTGALRTWTWTLCDRCRGNVDVFLHGFDGFLVTSASKVEVENGGKWVAMMVPCDMMPVSIRCSQEDPKTYWLHLNGHCTMSVSMTHMRAWLMSFDLLTMGNRSCIYTSSIEKIGPMHYIDCWLIKGSSCLVNPVGAIIQRQRKQRRCSKLSRLSDSIDPEPASCFKFQAKTSTLKVIVGFLMV